MVVRVEGRLVALAGGDEAPNVEFLPSEQDATTIVQLRLDEAHGRPTQALLSGDLTPPIAFATAAPEIDVTVGAIGPVAVGLAALTGGTVPALAGELEAAIAAADRAPGFLGTRVRPVGARLLLLPGPFDAAPAEFLRIALALDEPLDLDAATAYVRANVAPASHGETVHGETVGDGDAGATFQRLKLRKQPLTYVPSARPGGVTSSLQLLVNGVKWDETPELYGQPSTAQVYETRTEDDGATVLQFGDGDTGATLPTGGATSGPATASARAWRVACAPGR